MFNIHVPRYERIWLMIGIVTLAVFLVLFGVMAVSMGLNPPGHHQTIDPNAVSATAPFDNPGIQEIGLGEYNVSIVARLFMFQPDTIQVPAGSKVHFQVTSPDVVHGLLIAGTNVNMMIVPGHITQFTYTFKKPGDYLIVCNEYCGAGHQFMMGRIRVQ